MTYIYLVTSLFFALVASAADDNTSNTLGIKFPAIVGCVLYGFLALKGFGLI